MEYLQNKLPKIHALNRINISACSLVQLAGHIRQGSLRSEDVVRHFISCIEDSHAQLNAVVVPRFAQALERAKAADLALRNGIFWGRLHGVPITIKECLDWVGTPSTFGLRGRANDFPKKNDPYVQVLLDEGAIILGKTNVAQLLAYFEADNPLYGRTKNPLHPDFSPGGSSGGSAAVVASGGSPLGIGTDLGGSVRVPAAFCGIMSLKPTMLRNYDFSRLSENWAWEGMNSVVGPLGRQVEDLALVGEILGSIPNPVQSQPRPFPDYKQVDVPSLRLGYYCSDGLFPPMRAIQDGLLETVRKLEKQGIRCLPISPYQVRRAEALHTQFNSRDGARLFLASLKGEPLGRQLRPLIPLMRMPASWVHALGWVAGMLGQASVCRMSAHFGKTSDDLPEMLQELQAYRQGYLEMMEAEGIDAILSPVNALPAYLHGTSMQLGNAGTYTLSHNVTGFPAGVVSLGRIQAEDLLPLRAKAWDAALALARKTERKSEGLPIAMQVAARPWREDVVLAVMNVAAGLKPL